MKKARPPHYITVFGSSQAAPEGELYRQAFDLGKSLAQNGFGVISGGYGGAMEAVSRGAREAGGHTVGITLAAFNRLGLRANAWVDTEHKAATYLERLAELTGKASGFVALHGGIGTLSEVSLAWSLAQIGELGSKPVVLLGACWEPYLQVVREEFMVRPEDVLLLRWAADIQQAVALLRQSLW